MVKKVVALDVGSVRIGVAGNDALGITAQAIETWKRKGLQNDLEHIKQVAKDRMAVAYVLGLPRNMDGSEGPRAELYREFAALVEQECAMEVALWDERRTTVEAHNILSAHNYHGQKRKNTVDAVAASLILEGYLSYLSRL